MQEGGQLGGGPPEEAHGVGGWPLGSRPLPAAGEAGDAAAPLSSSVRAPTVEEIAADAVDQRTLLDRLLTSVWGDGGRGNGGQAGDASGSGAPEEIVVVEYGPAGLAAGEQVGRRRGRRHSVGQEAGTAPSRSSAPAGGLAVADANGEATLPPPAVESSLGAAPADAQGAPSGGAHPAASRNEDGRQSAATTQFEIDPLCTHCPNLGPSGFEDDEEEEPLLFHCTRYSGAGWSYECPPPAWAI